MGGPFLGFVGRGVQGGKARTLSSCPRKACGVEYGLRTDCGGGSGFEQFGASIMTSKVKKKIIAEQQQSILNKCNITHLFGSNSDGPNCACNKMNVIPCSVLNPQQLRAVGISDMENRCGVVK